MQPLLSERLQIFLPRTGWMLHLHSESLLYFIVFLLPGSDSGSEGWGEKWTFPLLFQLDITTLQPNVLSSHRRKQQDLPLYFSAAAGQVWASLTALTGTILILSYCLDTGQINLRDLCHFFHQWLCILVCKDRVGQALINAYCKEQ